MIKELIKAVAAGICFVALIPTFILYKIGIFSYRMVGHALSLIPGFFGIMFRRVWYKCTLASCGKNFTVDFLGIVRDARSCVGNDVYIGISTLVGWANIGDDCMLSGYIVCLSGGSQHGTKDFTTPMRSQEGKSSEITIGTDCWIGAHATIMNDIAAHSIVGAGSVVTKTFEEYDIIAGVPAKKIKSRKD